MTVRAGVSVLLLGVATTLGNAAEGRIPIWRPTVITQPGSYIVTRNIGTTACGSSDPISIDIQSDDVDVDLNGFTLYCGEPVIRVTGGSRVTIRDGQVVGYEDGLAATNTRSLALLRLKIQSNEDVAVNLSNVNQGVVEAVRLYFAGSGLIVTGSNVDIRHNEILGLSGSGTGISANCAGCRLSGNSLSDSHIVVAGSGNLVSDNVVSGGFEGLRVDGNRNHIEGNVLTDNSSFGLRLTGSNNVYRRNTAQGNAGAGCGANVDFCDSGASNRSANDNFMPTQL